MEFIVAMEMGRSEIYLMLTLLVFCKQYVITAMTLI